MLRKANNVFSVILGDVTVTTATVNSAVPVGSVVSNINLPNNAVVITDAGQLILLLLLEINFS